MFAASTGHEAVVRTLIKLGAAIQAKDKVFFSFLFSSFFLSFLSDFFAVFAASRTEKRRGECVTKRQEEYGLGRWLLVMKSRPCVVS
eukprot:1171609-Rhodomonas_salina.1